MQNAINYSDIVSPYGLLKSPWNADPSPYLSRSDRIFGLKNNLKVPNSKQNTFSLRIFEYTFLPIHLHITLFKISYSF